MDRFTLTVTAGGALATSALLTAIMTVVLVAERLA